jgi:hypothetical protein
MNPDLEPAADDEEFDPYIGITVADTWPKLGRLLATVQSEAPRPEVLINLKRWIDELWDDNEVPYDDALKAITPLRLLKFARDVQGLLERKFSGESIASEIRDRIAACGNFEIREEKTFVDLYEPPRVWWANEYRVLFADLVQPKSGKSWLHAVALCANEDCLKFFVKQRSDQRFHSEVCRARAANQRAYSRRRSKVRGRRGR